MSKKILLFLILFLAFFLRFYKLSEIPPGVNRDEASIGYTAYSILKTGKDEYSRRYPFSFQSFGDWKLPLYIYLTVPFVKVFGLSEFSVRALSAIAGTLTVLVTFFLVGELFCKEKPKYPISNIAYLASFLLAISPWHIHLSRVESESNVAVLFVSLATLLFLKAIRGKKHLLLASGVLYALTYYTYHGNHIFSTLLLSGILLIYNKAIPRTKTSFIGVLIFLIMVGFILSKTLISADKTKFAGISIFGDPTVVHTKIELPRNEHKNISGIFSRLMHNRFIYALEKISQNYILGFSPEFLFIKGGTNKAHNIANFGNMYLVEAPFLFLGLLYFFYGLVNCKDKYSKKSYLLILFWFFVSPITASITKDAPHTNRMFAIFPILSIVVAMGLLQFISFMSPNKTVLKFASLIMAILFFINISVYLDRYYVHFPKGEAKYWGKGYKKLARELAEQDFPKQKIIIANPLSSPYIFLLFYLKTDPILYQKTATRYAPTEDEFVHVKGFGRFEFRDIDWGTDINIGNRLLIDSPSNIPDAVRKAYKTRKIQLENGEIIFEIVEI